MNVLVIGGTIFLGRRLVEAAQTRGHAVTIFSRGLHNPSVHAGVETLRGDRKRDVSALRGRSWDAVVDTCGYVPSDVQRVMDAFDRGSTRHYTFVSSISVYERFAQDGTEEDGPLASISDNDLRQAESAATGASATARDYGEWYGALKVVCERTAEQAMPGRVLNVRPGLIVGRDDYTDRFTYWVRRVGEGGRVLAPGRPDRRVRVIDARDLAEWIVRMAEGGEAGVYNATGNEDGLTMGRMLDACREAAQSSARFAWVDEHALRREQVEPWSDLPLWLPDEHNGIFEARNGKAIARGLTFRPLADTVADTRRWDSTRPRDVPLRAGLTRDRERQILSKVTGMTDV